MALRWNEQCVEWYTIAANESTFHDTLADVIAPSLLKADTLCDVGCGLGRLSLALACGVASVVALDENPYAVQALRQRVAALELRNYTVVQGDAARLRVPYDVLLLSFFGRSTDAVLAMMPLCRRRMVCVVHAGEGGNLYPVQVPKKRMNTQSLQSALEDAGLRYRVEAARAEFGQPLRSEADGIEFILHHQPKLPQSEAEAFLRSHVVEKNSTAWPLYLPSEKKVSIFFIDAP